MGLFLLLACALGICTIAISTLSLFHVALTIDLPAAGGAVFFFGALLPRCFNLSNCQQLALNPDCVEPYPSKCVNRSS